MTLNSGYRHRAQLGSEVRGLHLLEHLAVTHPRDSLETWRTRLAAGELDLDGVVLTEDVALRPGQWLAWSRPPWEEPEAPLATAVLYEDAALLAVAKPSGLPTLPGGGAFQEHTLLALVRRRWPEASPMHRLGRGTSGLVLFAPTAAAAAPLRAAFQAPEATKVYRALCQGHPQADAFDIDAPIGEVPHAPLGTVHAAAPDGRPAHSSVRVLARREGAALVEVAITTGRPHQIRIHLAFAGHPLVGDPLYGPGGLPLEGSLTVPGDPGYLLHAHRLTLRHPCTGEPLVLTCAPPPALRD